MVSSISSSQQTYNAQFTDYTLTDDQKQTLEEIVAKYDSENMTGEDTKALFEELKSAGIPPSKDVKETLDAAGFKTPEKPNGEPPKTEGTELSSNAKTLIDILQKAETGEATQDEINAFITQLQSTSSVFSGSLIDTKA
jgi:hypothetical protein